MPENTTVVICPTCGAFREVAEDQSAVCTDNNGHGPAVMTPYEEE